MEKKLHVGSSVLYRYKDLNYRLWYAIAELVDNASQSYIENKKVLDSRNEAFEVKIGFENGEELVIHDNAYGMDEKDIDGLLELGKTKEKSSSGVQRSEFGMGLKTGGFWLGSKIEVHTKKHNSPKGFHFILDIDAIASGKPIVFNENTQHNSGVSFTNIKITGHHKTFSSYDISQTKKVLSSIYNKDIEEGKMIIKWKNTPLEPYKRSVYEIDGRKLKWDLDFDINGKRVTGFVALLKQYEPGRNDGSGRVNAGFSVGRNGRNVQCFPKWYKPTSVYGQDDGSNDRVNQRIFGHLEFDNQFGVSHTKDMLIFSGDEEEILHKKLASLCAEAKHMCDNGGLYSRGSKKKGLSKISKDETKSKLNTPEMEEIISGGLEFLDDDEATDDANSYVNDITRSDPHDEYRIGEVCWIKIWF